MIIIFFNKETNQEIPWQDSWMYYIDQNGRVIQDNQNTYESQSAVIGFEDFVKNRPDIGWRIKQE